MATGPWAVAADGMPLVSGQEPQATPVAGVRWYNLVTECTDPRRLADFWLAALGWREAYATEGEIGIEARDDPGERVPALVFWRTANPRRGKNRLHLDLRAGNRRVEVDRLIALGAAQVDVGQPGDAAWVVLADPEGNELCVQSEDETALQG
jgi:Glyoxalase-like domain